MSDARVEYDPNELVYRTPGTSTGTLYWVDVFPAEDEPEPVPLLLRVEDEIDDDLAIEAGAMHLRALGRYAEELDVEYEEVRPGNSGVWTPSPAVLSAPWARSRVQDVLSVGRTPLGATRGPEGSTEDYRWLYVATGPDTTPAVPLKRLTSAAHELGRDSVAGRSWGRINFPVRSHSTLFLRLTPGTPRAAVLISTDPADPAPCRMRIDLKLLNTWLAHQIGDPS